MLYECQSIDIRNGKRRLIRSVRRGTGTTCTHFSPLETSTMYKNGYRFCGALSSNQSNIKIITVSLIGLCILVYVYLWSSLPCLILGNDGPSPGITCVVCNVCICTYPSTGYYVWAGQHMHMPLYIVD